MNPQEDVALRSLLARLTRIRGVKKDPEAEALIRAAIAQQPDATYLLTQRVLLLEVALRQDRARIAELVNEAQRARSDYVDSRAPRQLAAPSPGPSLPLPPGVSAPATAPSFLKQAAATAAGVAGGTFLVEGIEKLAHHGGLFGGYDEGSALPAEDVTINNNYYSSEPGFEPELRDGLDSDGADVADADDDYV